MKIENNRKRRGSSTEREMAIGSVDKQEKRPTYNNEKFNIKSENHRTEELNDSEVDIIEGRNSILEALKSGRTINKIVFAKGDREGSIKQIAAMAKERGIVTTEADRHALDAMSHTGAHQGVIAFVAPKDYVEIEDILEAAEKKGEIPFIILLDGITDPHNLGSIIRTANAAGAHGVAITKRRSASLNSVVSKASAGALEYVPVARVANLTQTIEMLKKRNIWVIGTEMSARDYYFKTDLKGPIALVIGSEGEGMSRLVTEKCDILVKIPMMGEIASLNASVAGAVVMYEIAKARLNNKSPF
jgi:23S rRNA (guanosine2251-2'-O)-methyltransferase